MQFLLQEQEQIVADGGEDGSWFQQITPIHITKKVNHQNVTGTTKQYRQPSTTIDNH